jgi:hypothetical protein
MLLFSSDFPHFEGFSDPGTYYSDFFTELGQRRRELFMGDGFLELFDRMGDPLDVTARAPLQPA